MPVHEIRFRDAPLDRPFRHNGNWWWRVPRAVDRLGGYNAQNANGKRALFFNCQKVELLDGGGRKRRK